MRAVLPDTELLTEYVPRALGVEALPPRQPETKCRETVVKGKIRRRKYDVIVFSEPGKQHGHTVSIFCTINSGIAKLL